MPRLPILMMSKCFLLVLTLAVAAPFARAQAPKQDTPDGDYSAELPRLAPTEPADAIAKFTLAPGFRIELVACEPEVVDPVAMAFDEANRIYVVEMRDYSEQDKERLGRIRLLEDRDNDGRYETSSVLIERLSWPTAILCYDGGVFVGAAPDLLYLKDQNGDGRIDRDNAAEYRVIYTGFGRSNVQGLMNSFQWGPNNRVYVAVSSSGGKLKCVARPGLPEVDLRGRDLAFNPKTFEFETIAGGAQHGMSFTKWGERLVCSNSDHLQWIAYDDAYAAQNPYLSAPPARLSIAADGPQAEVFRTSPVEPWRIVRTRLRVTGVIPGIVEGGGRAAGYFTSATGVTAVVGTAFPPVPGDDHAEWVIVGDVGSNLVHRKKLYREQGMLRGVRVDEKSELLTSSDNWFRPVQFANGPDGALYILDMYREVIEHPDSIPPAIKKHLDLTSGRDRGRIWRLVREDWKRTPPTDLSKLSTDELISCLGNENGWTRTTASRLLYERFTPDVAAALQQSAERGNLSPIALYHHLHLLAASPKTGDALIAKCLSHPSAPLRAAALHICGRQARSQFAPQAAQLLSDEDPFVRRAAALALSTLGAESYLEPLAKLALRDARDPYTRYAVLLCAAGTSGRLAESLVRQPEFLASPDRRLLLETLAGVFRREQRAAGTGTPGRPEANQRESSLQSLLTAMKYLCDQEPSLAIDFYYALSPERGSPFAKRLGEAVGDRLNTLILTDLEKARAAARNTKLPDAERIAALSRLARSHFATEKALLDELLIPSQSNQVQLALIDLAGQFDEPQVAHLLLSKWPFLTPPQRERALSRLTTRLAWLEALFRAIDEQSIPPLDISPAVRAQLAQHPNKEIRNKAAELFGKATSSQREAILAEYRSALTAEGDAEKGRLLFRQHCSACHKLEGVGNETGPNLAAMKARGAEAILINVLDPNREVLPQFQSYVAELADGRVVSGLIESESPTTLVLRKADGQKEELLRGDIELLRSTGQSLMPEGLEKQIDPKAMADLLAYLMKAE